MKITFEINTEPQSFDAEDEIMNLLQDEGMMNTLEGQIASVIDRLYGMGFPRIMVSYTKNIKRRTPCPQCNSENTEFRGIFCKDCGNATSLL